MRDLTTIVDHLHRDEEGQASAEYVGIVVIVGIIIAALAGSGIGGEIASGLSGLISEILAN